MKTILTIAAILVVGCSKTPEPSVTWRGYMTYGYRDGSGEIITHVETNKQIGLRSDGVLVFRDLLVK